MKPRLSALLATIALGAVLSGCAQKRTQPVVQSVAPRKVVQLPPPPPEETPAEGEKVKQPRFGESVVYIDGKPIGVIRASELPLGLKGRTVNVGGGYHATHYGILAYLRALGIDTKPVQAIHLYGGSRISLVDKAEVARIGERLEFSFVQGDHGKPRVEWPPTKLHVNTTIDMISNVAIYIEKAPPTLGADGELVMPNGERVTTKVPYAPEEQGNGTRIYVDGVLSGTVKRKKITNDMIFVPASTRDTAAAKTEPSKGEPEDRFSVLAYAAKLRPEAKQAKSIDLLAGDDVLAHVDSDGARDLTFYVPAHNRGQAVVEVPSSDGAHRARITAIQIYVHSTPPARPIVKIDSAPEAFLGRGQGGGAGAGSDDEL
jgi:hypothetical protein